MTNSSQMMSSNAADTNRDEEKFVIKKYNDVVRSAELLDVRLTSSKFDVKPEYYGWKDRDKAFREESALDLEGGLKWTQYDAEHGLLVGNFDWKAGCKKNRRKLLSITATYLIAYRVLKDSEEKYAHVFLASVGRFAIFPYFRSLVSQYSAASMADLPILPVLKEKIGGASDAEDIEDTEDTE